MYMPLILPLIVLVEVSLVVEVVIVVGKWCIIVSVIVNACQILMGRRNRRDFAIGLSVMRTFLRRGSIKALHNSLAGMLHVVPSY